MSSIEVGASAKAVVMGFNSPVNGVATDPSAGSMTIFGPDSLSTIAIGPVALASWTKIGAITGAYGYLAGISSLAAGEYIIVVTATVDGIPQVAVQGIRISQKLANMDAEVSTRAKPTDIISDATPFPGQYIDTNISTRATKLDIVSDGVAFPGANIDVAVSSRAAPGDPMTLTAGQVLAIVADIWGEDLPGSYTGTDAGKVLADILAAQGISDPKIADIWNWWNTPAGTLYVTLDAIKNTIDTMLDDDVETYDRTTDSLQALRDRLDAIQLGLQPSLLVDLSTISADIGVATGPTPSKNLRVEIDESEVKIDSVITKIDALANASRWSLEVPERINKPATGGLPIVYRLYFRLHDNLMAPLDPDLNTVNFDILLVAGGGSIIGGPTTMTRDGVGLYHYDFSISDVEDEGPISVQTDWTETAVPYNHVRASEVVDDDAVEDEIITRLTDIETDTDEIQGKLPDDEIMGSVDKVSRSPEIDAMYGKLPDDFIMGSSVKDSMDDEIDAIKAVTDIISEYPHGVIAIPSVLNRPSSITAIDMEDGLEIGILDLVVNDTSLFEDVGILRIDDELMSYTKVSAMELTVIRASHGTIEADHLDAASVYPMNRAVLAARYWEDKFKVITAVGGEIELDTPAGTLFPTGTQAASVVVGHLEYRLLADRDRIYGYGASGLVQASDAPSLESTVQIIFRLTDPVTYGEESPEVYGALSIVELPSSGEIVSAVIAGGWGELACDEIGYFKSDGTRVLWTDDLAGPVRDEAGVRIDDAFVSFWRVGALNQPIFDTPAAQTRTNPNGRWRTFLDAGKYYFTIRSYDLDFGSGVLRTLVA